MQINVTKILEKLSDSELQSLVFESSAILRERVRQRGLNPETPIEQVGLSVASMNVLKFAGVRALSDLQHMSKMQVLQLRNFGRKGMHQLEKIMQNYNLKFLDEE